MSSLYVTCSRDIINADIDLGVGIKNIESEQYHIGLLYKQEEAPPRLLHLAWHHDLKDVELPSDYFIGLSDLDRFNKMYMVSLASRVANFPQEIPYSIVFDGDTYFDDTGKYLPISAGTGLTCATFVLALFENSGFKLVNFSTWSNRTDDVIWQRKIIQTLRDKGGSSDHIEALEKNIGASRLRPEEACAAVISKIHPIDFKMAKKMAADIIKDLSKIRTR
ncbi:hypothetical protein [Polynucleobacter sp. Fuers-14]|uniref:hypothetical protein n=1 Tax=Polynucleobacter sp. Fuers-14 TaxID=1758364 RepID=UPI001C0D9A6A|nr:hypothetical protein [Polynucleobacter sp. Fuers-14]MBU3641628.1 hypothetical protein [Polynucleobacter sp. Fuers-14]